MNAELQITLPELRWFGEAKAGNDNCEDHPVNSRLKDAREMADDFRVAGLALARRWKSEHAEAGR